jgi:hypothetical protein
VDVADERQLAGRVVGWMFVMSTLVALVLPLFPGVDGLLGELLGELLVVTPC